MAIQRLQTMNPVGTTHFHLKKIASIFNVSMDYLLGVNDIRYPYVIDDGTAAFNEFA
ncbi:MAG: hypothetical protein V8Q32_02815 [Anaerotignum faecicola]